jgi:hypothetical protein
MPNLVLSALLSTLEKMLVGLFGLSRSSSKTNAIGREIRVMRLANKLYYFTWKSIFTSVNYITET